MMYTIISLIELNYYNCNIYRKLHYCLRDNIHGPFPCSEARQRDRTISTRTLLLVSRSDKHCARRLIEY